MRTIIAKIVSGILICVMLASGIIGVLSIQNATKTANEDAELMMEDECINHAEELNGLISRIEQSVDTLSAIALEMLDFSQFKNNDSYVESYTDSLRTMVNQFAEHTDGSISAYIRYNPDFTNPTSGIYLSRTDLTESFTEVTPTDFSMYEEDDEAHVGWYYIPVNYGEPLWMSPYLNENNNVYMTSYVVPLFVDGESVGIIGMDIQFSQITDLVSSIGIYEKGYAFLLDESGLVLSHKDLDINTNLSDVDQGAMSQTVTSILDGTGDDTLLSYKYQGMKKKLVSTRLENGMYLVLTAEESDMYETANSLKIKVVSIMIVTLLLVNVVGIIIARSISRPIRKLTDIVLRIAELNFCESEELAKLVKSKDETGIMAKAVQQMSKSLREVMNQIIVVENGINTDMNQMNSVMTEMNSIAEDNSATTEELAAAMEETAANTTAISANIGSVQENSQKIAAMTRQGRENSEEVQKRAQNLEESVRNSSRKAVDMLQKLQETSQQAIEKSKAVIKINELTENIKNVSEQTNLLALNASIEAARAGEAGRGFSVVATEIGSLANQTYQTVERINDIVEEVNMAVVAMTDCIQGMMGFMNQTVMIDYGSLQGVGEQYLEDANGIRQLIENIDTYMSQLNHGISDIQRSVEEISVTVEQSAQGVSQIAEKSAETAQKTADGYQQLNDTNQSMEQLNQVVSQFTIA